ncbi:MAG: FtsX-like permease family protein, partial [Deltaproteobacteria bacterium]
MRTVYLACRRAVVDLARHPATTALTGVTVAVMFWLMGSLATVGQNLAALAERLRGSLVVKAFLASDCGQECRKSLLQEFSAAKGVARAELVDESMAIERFRRRLGKDAAILDLVGENPLPASVELRLSPGWNRKVLDALVQKLRSATGVEDVYGGGAWLGRMERLGNTVRTLGLVVGVLVLLVAVVVVANTIRLSVYSRRQEAEIMALVGGTEFFIKAPFYLQGLLVGTAGAALGLGMTRILFEVAGGWFGVSTGYGQQALKPEFLSAGWVAAFCALGALLGLGG